jgi:virulence-associated protein VagC
MQTLTLNKRPGKIGGNINVRTERHGDDEKPALDIPLSGIPLTPEEVGNLLGDATSYDSLFTSARSKFLEPRWLGVPYIPFAEKFKNAKVTINAGGAKLVLKPATVQKIKLFLVGDQVAMACTISASPDEGVQVLEMLNLKCVVSILGGAVADKAENQQDLGLEGGGPVIESLADALIEEDDATESVIGRQIRASEAKKKRANRKDLNA